MAEKYYTIGKDLFDNFGHTVGYMHKNLDVSGANKGTELADAIQTIGYMHPLQLESEVNLNAVASDIVEGKTAYVYDQKITGTLPAYKGKTNLATPSTPTYTVNVTNGKLTLKTAKTYCPEDITVSASFKTWDGTFTGKAEIIS